MINELHSFSGEFALLATNSPSSAAEHASPLTEDQSSVSSPVSPLARLRSIGRLPNHLILSELLQLNQQQRHLEAELLLFLGELEQRRLYREHAVASAFEFCVARLGYSEDVAWKRVGAARLIRRFPRVYELLVEGRIHLTALMLVKPHLTEENHEEWLSLACNKSKRQVEKLVASRCPRPDVPTSLRRLPQVRSNSSEMSFDVATSDEQDVSANGRALTPSTKAESEHATNASPTAGATSTLKAAEPGQVDSVAGNADPAASASTTRLATAAVARVAPLSSSTYRVTFTASERLKQKLDRASELLSHCISPSNLPALLERALDDLLEREEKRRFGAQRSAISRASRPALRNRTSEETLPSIPRSNLQSIPTATRQRVVAQHESCQKDSPMQEAAQDPVPASGAGPQRNSKPNGAKRRSRRQAQVAVKQAVFERDGGQCTYVDQQGRRCSQRHCLEFDHIDAHAVGGGETVENLRLLCKSHNQLEAERLFGRERVNSAIRRAKRDRLR